MGAIKKILRGLVIAASIALLVVGGFAVAISTGADVPAVAKLEDAVAGALDAVADDDRASDLGISSSDLAFLHGPARFVLAPLGLVLLVVVLLPGRKSSESDTGDGGDRSRDTGLAPVDSKTMKKVKKTAAALAKRGQYDEAAELAVTHGMLEDAARYYMDAGDFSSAGEVRHDQNRFLEAAELQAKAGRHDVAGSIYSQQEEWERAAEAYQEAGNTSVAAEMFVKAKDYRRAANCFAEAGFPRHAAQAYSRCEMWEQAAKALEEAIRDEGHVGGGQNPKKEAELAKMYKAAGTFYRKAGQAGHAQEVLEKGGQFAEAAEIALTRDRREDAANLFFEAKDVLRAAELMKELGDTERAATVLAEYHRDRGEDARAAEQFVIAGEDLAAGDLYRLLERYEEAGGCFERKGEYAQAAEMFQLAENRVRAAENYEKGGQFSEAAECHALAGNSEREAELLAMAGEFFRAGEIHHHDGRIDEAIKELQKVDPERPEAAQASALLGGIFRERGMTSLAVKKLSDAVEGEEISPGNVRVFYELATVYEANDEPQEAHDLYERILAFDFHYGDVEQRIATVRATLEELAAQSAVSEAPMGQSREAGRYKVTGKLGRGGMGIVYRAQDTVLDRVVALKVLPESFKENPQSLKNFLREAKSAAQLNHPNIVTVYDAGEQDGVYYIAMEYVDGSTLKEIVKQRGRVSAAGIVHILAQMCEALAFAHDNKIVHRDVKTANTMWTRDRKAKIMDFGLAKVLEEVRNHTTVVSGTPYYMSPEQALGKNIDHRTDIYSLGVTLFELATGTLPFTEGNLPYHHLHTPAPDPRDLAPDLPELIAGIIRRCLEKDPSDRYDSARDILAEVRSTLGG